MQDFSIRKEDLDTLRNFATCLIDAYSDSGVENTNSIPYYKICSYLRFHERSIRRISDNF